MNHAAKIERAAVRQAMLRTTLPQDIAWGVTVAAGGDVRLRGVLVGGFTDDGEAIIGWEPDRTPVPMTDERALKALFRGVFFPADYDNARDALDAHEARRRAWEAGDDAAAAKAERTLRRLRREPIVVG